MEVRIIDAARQSYLPSAAEVWKHRELTLLFVQRYLTGRYRQMALGSAWALLEPLFQLLMLTLVFGVLLRADSNGFPYPVYVFAALIPWQHFSRTTMAVAGSLQENAGLIAKVYFPRIILPVAAALRELVDTGIQLGILIVFAMFYGYYPSLKFVLLAPVVMLLVSVAGAGIGLLAAAVVIRYRDLRPALGIALQAGMYATPVLYAASMVPERFQAAYQVNPMYWAVAGFRHLLLGQPVQPSLSLAAALALVALVAGAGLFVFSHFERMAVDVL
jgi:lipopolysaccharide transport system permease protein